MLHSATDQMDIRFTTSRLAVKRGLAVGLVAWCLLILSLGFSSAFAQSALTADVREALARLSSGQSTQRDQALLFANNNAINAAGQNGSISDAQYQAAQGAYDKTNQAFAKRSAKSAGAGFKVQDRSSATYVPGTDSDYITEVTSKDQIPQMQSDYNRRVNDYMKRNGVVEQRSNWHNKLDVDFMADPKLIRDPEEFRAIAKYNNDAYKNRYAAEYEALSRSQNGGKIGPQHVDGYLNEMNDFAKNKGNKIEGILAKGPSHLNDPINRAELFQAMAQRQKYTSRLESLDEILRKQEGLPPRKGGPSISKLGTSRLPGNSGNVRLADAVADSSRFSALENLAETMGQVSKKNPGFNPNSADDIAKIIEALPPGRRAGALSRIRANGGAGLVDDIMSASARAGRLPSGSGSLLDDVARSNLDELAKLGNKLDTAADLGKARRALNAAGSAMDALGKIAATAEVAEAAASLGDFFALRSKIMDPNTPDSEIAELVKKAEALARKIRNSAALSALVERYPAVAVAFGSWSAACAVGEWISPTRKSLPPGVVGTNCVDRHVNALDRATDRYGTREEFNDQSQGLCGKFMAAVRAKKVRPKDIFSVKDICKAIARRDLIGDMIELTPEQPKPVPVNLTAPTCVPEENLNAIGLLREAAGRGANKAIARLESINASIARADSKIAAAKNAYGSGDTATVLSSLSEAQAILVGFSGAPSCPAQLNQVALGIDKANQLERVLVAARSLIASCNPDAIESAKQLFGNMTHPALQKVLLSGAGIPNAHTSYQQARAKFISGDLIGANQLIANAARSLNVLNSGICTGLRTKVSDAAIRIRDLRDMIADAEAAVTSCNEASVSVWIKRLASVSNPAAAPVKRQLARAKPYCSTKIASQAQQKANFECSYVHGARSFASKYFKDGRAPVCDCNSSSKWDSSHSRCIKKSTPAEQAATRNAQCVSKFGAGYHSRSSGVGGKYNCIPLRKTATAWCNANNKGSGWTAGTVKPDGTYSCNRSRRSASAWCNANNKGGGWTAGPAKKDGTYSCIRSRKSARRDCRAQAKRNRKVYAYTQFLKNGGYSCRWCNRGSRFRKGRCYAVQARKAPRRIQPRKAPIRRAKPRQRTKRCGSITDPGTLGRLVIPKC